MFEKLNIIALFLSMPQNRIFTAILFISIVMLIFGLFLVSKKRHQATGVAVLLLALTPFLYSSMLLVKRAFYEVSLVDYHVLAKKTKRSKVFNTLVNEHLNKYQNRINGLDFAKLEYNWRRLSVEQQGVDSEDDEFAK